ncbi:hypothetical protein TA3x_000133 [Tundrisphaera sp. TA3]|uniref:hypothetical protein n=1 Tax=Tundrisphaera sp. TA3 TaxID=3435775 RepID=UPI003EC0D007
MPSENWGKCRGCKMWQIEPEAATAERTMGICLAEGLEPFRLRVSGNSGCKLFVHGKVQRAEGSSLAPPLHAETN